MNCMKNVVILAFAVLFATPCHSAATKDTCQQAYEACDFRFYKPGVDKFYRTVPEHPVGIWDVHHFTNTIASTVKSERYTGVLYSEGVVPEFINKKGKSRPITKYGTPRLAANQFSPIELNMHSAIRYEPFLQSQLEAVKGKCLRVWFTKYEVRESYGGAVTEVKENVQREENKCIVVRISN